jgi:hypothetical protein
MKFLMIFLLLGSMIVVNAAKVTWDSNGKPKIEASGKPIKGCNQASLKDLLKDRNSSDCDS